MRINVASFVEGIYVSLCGDGEIILCSNKAISNDHMSELALLSQIKERERFIGSLCQEFDYSKATFNRKEILLRYFAFLFNTVTMSKMK